MFHKSVALRLLIWISLIALALFIGSALDAPHDKAIKDCVVAKHKDVATCNYLYKNTLPIE